MLVIFIIWLTYLPHLIAEKTPNYFESHNSSEPIPTAKVPKDLKAPNISSRSVQLSWNAALDNASSIQGYIVQYKESHLSWAGRMLQVFYSGQQTIHELNNLKPGTIYNIRVVAKTKIGESEPSNTITVTTVNEIIFGPPTAVRVDAADQHSLNVYWKTPSTPNWGEKILGYYLGYKIAVQNDSYTFETVESPDEFYQEHHFLITNLNALVTYSIIIRAFNVIGPGPASKEVIARTIYDGHTPSSAYDIVCTTLTSHSIGVSWLEFNCADGIIKGCKVIYGPSHLWHDENIRKIKTTVRNDIVLQDLWKYTNYTVQVIPYTSMADGVPSNPIRCQTKEDVPGDPQSVKGLIVSQSSALITWKPADGVVVKYIIYMKEAYSRKTENVILNSVAKVHELVPDINSNNFTFQAEGLDSMIKYEFWVTASNVVGEGRPSKVILLTPSAQVPARIISFDGTMTATYQQNATLRCLAVGLPSPTVLWKFKKVVVAANEHVHQQSDGSLFIRNVSRSHAGEYSCHVENLLAKDDITYRLNVKSPPGSPNVTLLAATANSLIIKLTPHANDTEPVMKYKIIYKPKNRSSGFFSWRRIQIEYPARTYTIKNLRCNKWYMVVVAAYNSLGRGEPSHQLLARTQGSKPEIPRVEEFIEPLSNSTLLHLDAWFNECCGKLDFKIQIRASFRLRWTQVNTLDTDETILLENLEHNVLYKLQSTVTNNVGSSTAEYQFSLS